MNDPYPVRKELLQEWYDLNFQCVFYEETNNKIAVEQFVPRQEKVIKQIVKERQDQVFDLFGHATFFHSLFVVQFGKILNDFDTCLILYCLQHKGFITWWV